MMVFCFGFKMTICVKTFGIIGLSGFSQKRISLKVFKDIKDTTKASYAKVHCLFLYNLFIKILHVSNCVQESK